MKPKITIINEGILNIDTAVYQNTDLTLINRAGGTVNVSSSRSAIYETEFIENQDFESISTAQIEDTSSISFFTHGGYSSSAESNEGRGLNLVFEIKNRIGLFIQKFEISDNYQGGLEAEIKILEEMRHSHIQFLAERRYSK